MNKLVNRFTWIVMLVCIVFIGYLMVAEFLFAYALGIVFGFVLGIVIVLSDNYKKQKQTVKNKCK